MDSPRLQVYDFLKVLGRGSHGEAWLVRHKTEKKLFVLKKVNLTALHPAQRVASFQEVKLLQNLHHTNIVEYKDSFVENEDTLYIVMTYCEGGDLFARLQQQGRRYIDEKQILDWFVQITMGLQYIHKNKVIHRDLKTQNIFLKGNKIKIGDFGISRVLNDERDLAQTQVGTPYYMSPELLANKPYGYRSDVWALGCCLFEMMSLRHAFDAKEMGALVFKVINGSTPSVPAQYSSHLKDLVRLLLSKQPSQRPTCAMVLKMPFVKKHIEAHFNGQPGLQSPLGSAAVAGPPSTPTEAKKKAEEKPKVKKLLIRPVPNSALSNGAAKKPGAPLTPRGAEKENRKRTASKDEPSVKGVAIKPVSAAAPSGGKPAAAVRTVQPLRTPRSGQKEPAASAAAAAASAASPRHSEGGDKRNRVMARHTGAVSKHKQRQHDARLDDQLDDIDEEAEQQQQQAHGAGGQPVAADGDVIVAAANGSEGASAGDPFARKDLLHRTQQLADAAMDHRQPNTPSPLAAAPLPPARSSSLQAANEERAIRHAHSALGLRPHVAFAAAPEMRQRGQSVPPRPTFDAPSSDGGFSGAQGAPSSNNNSSSSSSSSSGSGAAGGGGGGQQPLTPVSSPSDRSLRLRGRSQSHSSVSEMRRRLVEKAVLVHDWVPDSRGPSPRTSPSLEFDDDMMMMMSDDAAAAAADGGGGGDFPVLDSSSPVVTASHHASLRANGAPAASSTAPALDAVEQNGQEDEPDEEEERWVEIAESDSDDDWDYRPADLDDDDAADDDEDDDDDDDQDGPVLKGSLQDRVNAIVEYCCRQLGQSVFEAAYALVEKRPDELEGEDERRFMKQLEELIGAGNISRLSPLLSQLVFLRRSLSD